MLFFVEGLKPFQLELHVFYLLFKSVFFPLIKSRSLEIVFRCMFELIVIPYWRFFHTLTWKLFQIQADSVYSESAPFLQGQSVLYSVYLLVHKNMTILLMWKLVNISGSFLSIKTSQEEKLVETTCNKLVMIFSGKLNLILNFGTCFRKFCSSWEILRLTVGLSP